MQADRQSRTSETHVHEHTMNNDYCHTQCKQTRTAAQTQTQAQLQHQTIQRTTTRTQRTTTRTGHVGLNAHTACAHKLDTSQDAEQRTNAMGGKLQITTSNSEPTNKGTGGSCRSDYASSLTTGSGRRYGPPPSHWQYICGK